MPLIESALELFLVFLLGIAPVSEIRGALPAAYLFFAEDGAAWFGLGCAVGIAGNLAVAPLVLFTLNKVERAIVGGRRAPSVVKRLYGNVLSRIRARARRFETAEAIMLTIFVAVPFPFTGAWTGSLIAYVLGMNRRRALISIELGVLGASAIVLVALLALKSLMELLSLSA